MNTKWMGRYRPLVAALVRHSNLVQRGINTKFEIESGISLSSQEWQVFEYIIEHLNDDAHMNMISDRLGIPQSSFSKMVKLLCGYGLVEKYQMTNNRKNIILRPSELGLSIYEKHATSLSESTFADFFIHLESIGDEEIGQLTNALETFNDKLIEYYRSSDVKLVRKDA